MLEAHHRFPPQEASSNCSTTPYSRLVSLSETFEQNATSCVAPRTRVGARNVVNQCMRLPGRPILCYIPYQEARLWLASGSDHCFVLSSSPSTIRRASRRELPLEISTARRKV